MAGEALTLSESNLQIHKPNRVSKITIQLAAFTLTTGCFSYQHSNIGKVATYSWQLLACDELVLICVIMYNFSCNLSLISQNQLTKVITTTCLMLNGFT